MITINEARNPHALHLHGCLGLPTRTIPSSSSVSVPYSLPSILLWLSTGDEVIEFSEVLVDARLSVLGCSVVAGFSSGWGGIGAEAAGGAAGDAAGWGWVVLGSIPAGGGAEISRRVSTMMSCTRFASAAASAAVIPVVGIGGSTVG